MSVPTFLTRYYQKGEYPFMSLNDLPYEEANRVKQAHCKKNGIGLFYAQDDYLIHRREIERWLCRELISLGGRPANDVPIYMTLGKTPDGEFGMRADVQRGAQELRVPLGEIDLSAVTFTYPDSMYYIEVDTHGKQTGGGRTNTPRVYLYADLPDVIERYKVYDDYRVYVEAQVWNREMLHACWLRATGVTQ